MNRLQLLMAAGGAALATTPSAAVAKRNQGDGFKTIPYVPDDTVPYYDPIYKLKAKHVDRGIWDAVYAINRSGWVWTAESCQGHRTGWSRWPMIRLVCRDADKGDMLATLLASVPVGALHGKGRGEGRVEIIRHTPAPVGWFEVRVYVRRGGISVFERFARRL